MATVRISEIKQIPVFQVSWSTHYGQSGFTSGTTSRAEADASAQAERKAGRNAMVICARCGENDSDFCKDLAI